MKVFIGGNVYDSRRHVIGVVLSDADKVNICAMAPESTVYSEFVVAGQGARGTRGFSPASVEELLVRIKEQPDTRHFTFDDDGVEV